MTITQAIILGLVQGLAEFLPISSSGHLAILQYFFEIDADKVLIFSVMLHLGTLISVFIVYWKDIVELCIELVEVIKDIFTGKGLGLNKNPTRRLGYMIIVATIPTAIIGVLFDDIFKGFYTTLLPIGIGLLITGTVLKIAEKINKNKKDIMEMSFLTALIVGICQGIAITPGISRSGSTLFGGLISGVKREVAVKYAFLISIPSIIGSVIFEISGVIEQGFDSANILPIIVGMTVAAVSGLIAIKTMIAFVSKQKLVYFSYYTWVLGIAIIGYTIFLS